MPHHDYVDLPERPPRRRALLAPMLYVAGFLSGLGYAAARLGWWRYALAEFLLAAMALGLVACVVVGRRREGK